MGPHSHEEVFRHIKSIKKSLWRDLFPFDSKRLLGDLIQYGLGNAITKSVHEHVIYQSGTERAFADRFEKNEAIKVYAKSPGWFRAPTPLGPYTPDWAVLVEFGGIEQLYFVVETKSSLFDIELRDKEGGKIKCGEAHFAELVHPERQ